MFLKYLLVAIAANCENSSVKLLVKETYNVTRLMRLVRFITMKSVRSEMQMSDDGLIVRSIS